jgi:hypothetical protein
MDDHLFADPETSSPDGRGAPGYSAIAPGKLERRSRGGESTDAAELDPRIARFAPVYLTFPEGNPNVAPPHAKGGDHDYHPRVVEHFLDDARLVETRTWARKFYLFYLSTFLVAIPLVLFDWFNPTVRFLNEYPLLWAFLVGFWVSPYVANVLSTTRSAKGVDAIRTRLEDRLAGGLESSSLRVEYFRGSAYVGGLRSLIAAIRSVDSSSHAWRMYTQKIQSDAAKYPRVIYANLAAGSPPADLVIQYWAFYYFNDWENKHPADWECVTLFFDSTEKDSVPVAAAYSNHLGSLWRPWDNVCRLQTEDKQDTDHPLVYVALGSHAQYFEPKDIGYEAPFAWNVPSLFGRLDARVVGTRGAATGRERDHVVPSTDVKIAEITNTYQLRAAPADLLAIDPFIPGQVAWKAWWWLRFRGRWAETYQPIAGPAAQLQKWFKSFDWVEKSGQADDRWTKLFTVPTAETTPSKPHPHLRKTRKLVARNHRRSADRRNGSGPHPKPVVAGH